MPRLSLWRLEANGLLTEICAQSRSVGFSEVYFLTVHQVGFNGFPEIVLPIKDPTCPMSTEAPSEFNECENRSNFVGWEIIQNPSENFLCAHFSEGFEGKKAVTISKGIDWCLLPPIPACAQIADKPVLAQLRLA